MNFCNVPAKSDVVLGKILRRAFTRSTLNARGIRRLSGLTLRGALLAQMMSNLLSMSRRSGLPTW